MMRMDGGVGQRRNESKMRGRGQGRITETQQIENMDVRFFSRAYARARGSSRTCPCTSVSPTEDTVSVDANASQLGSRPKALSGIEFHQTSFNQQVFKVRITPPSPPAPWPRLKQTQAGAGLR